MAREKTKKDPADYSVEEKLKNLYALQSLLSEIDNIKTLRGELPLEVQVFGEELRRKIKFPRCDTTHHLYHSV